MLETLVTPLLEELGKRTTHSAPTLIERVIGHLCYLVGLAIPVIVILRWNHVIGGSIGTGTLAAAALGLAAFTFLFLFWAVRFRQVAPQRWFVSHMLWIARTFATLGLLITVGLLVLMFSLLFAAMSAVIAGVAIYGGALAAGLVTLWLVWRCGRGYWRYVRGEEIGLPPES